MQIIQSIAAGNNGQIFEVACTIPQVCGNPDDVVLCPTQRTHSTYWPVIGLDAPITQNTHKHTHDTHSSHAHSHPPPHTPHQASSERHYALKMVFNYGVATGQMRNLYANEFLVVSRLPPHRNIVRFFAQVRTGRRGFCRLSVDVYNARGFNSPLPPPPFSAADNDCN